MGDCRHCGRNAGWFRSSHNQCLETYQRGLAQMVELVIQAADRPDFSQRGMLRILATVAQQCYVPAEGLHAVLAAGWHLSPMNRMVASVANRSEASRFREFRDSLPLATTTANGAVTATLMKTAVDAALATRYQTRRLAQAASLLERLDLPDGDGRELLLQAWEQAVARQLHDTGIDMDREAALLRYARYFDLDDAVLDHNGMLRQLIQGAAIAEAAADLVPHRMDFSEGATAPGRLNKPEQLVWLFDNVECRVGPLPSEPSATITGAVAPDRTLPYYPPQLFVSRDMPTEGWGSVTTGRLAVTSARLLFRGPGNNTRLSYDSVRRWEPYHDGIGVVPRRQPDRLVVFRNGDGWFSYNLTLNLAAHSASGCG